MVENMESEKFCDFHSLSSLKAGDVVLGSFSDSVKNTLPFQSTVSEITSTRMSWADMTQKDELEDEEQKESELDMQNVDASTSLGDSTMIPAKRKLSREERERFWFMNVKKMKVFTCFEKVNGKMVNIVEGFELHTGVVSAVEQKKIVEHIYELQEKGRKGELRERTYTASQKWMRGKGRVTIQFGCCYNYATDKAGNPPGILQEKDVDPIPSLFKPTQIEEATPSSSTQQPAIVRHKTEPKAEKMTTAIRAIADCGLTTRNKSVLVLKGNGADVAKHCVPAVPRKRISITFRKMDESKTPVGFIPEPDLQELKPLPYKPTTLATTISSSLSNNEENGARAVHIEGSKHRKSRDYRFESREWSSSSRRGK